MQPNFGLLCFCILVIQAKAGVYGQCSNPPENQVVFEGTQNITMTCNSSSNVSYTITPTTDELINYVITNNSDDVATSLKDLFAVNSTDLVIKIAQGIAAVSPISTVGEYVVSFPDSTKFGFKLVVVASQGATCCSTTNSTHIQMSCSLMYGDSRSHPINAQMTWTSDGNAYSTVVPARTTVDQYYVESLSSITVNAGDQSTFRCRVSFTKPTNVGPYPIAMNAPTYSSYCVVQCPCNMPLKNIVAYEGDTNIQVYYPANHKAVQWTMTETTDMLTLVNIVNYTDTVNPYFTADYAFDSSGLTIRNATIMAGTGHNISTAGLYNVQCGNNQVVSFKLLVIREGPICSEMISPNATNVQISCSVIYADTSYDAMNAVFTFYVDGQPTATDTPQRNTNDAYTYISTSTFSSTYKASSVYQCVLTFGQPTDVQDQTVTMNNSAFSRNCTA